MREKVMRLSRRRATGWIGAALLVLAGGQFLGGIAQTSCFITLTPTSAQVSSGGLTGNNYLTFYANTNCALTVSTGYSWLHAITASLGGAGNISTQVEANTDSASRAGFFQVSASDGNAAQFSVTQAAACTPTSLTVQVIGSLTFSAGLPVSVRVQVADSCGNPVNSGAVAVAFSNSDPTLTLVSTGGGVWQGTWSPRNVQSQVILNIFASAPQGNTLITGAASIVATLTSATTTTPLADRILDSATFQAKAFAPGNFISIFGTNLANSTASAGSIPLPTTMGGTSVSAGGKLLPLFYVSPVQINTILPYSIPVNTTQQLTVVNGTAVSTPFTISIAAADPGIFTADQSGSGAGVIVNQDGTLNSAANPAARGSTVVIYCAGLGAVSPAVTDGAGAPASPLAQTSNSVVVGINSVGAAVQFAGLTPGFAGLYQVNTIVPATAPTGSAVPVSIGVVVGSSVLSSQTVTMAVK